MPEHIFRAAAAQNNEHYFYNLNTFCFLEMFNFQYFSAELSLLDCSFFCMSFFSDLEP